MMSDAGIDSGMSGPPSGDAISYARSGAGGEPTTPSDRRQIGYPRLNHAAERKSHAQARDVVGGPDPHHRDRDGRPGAGAQDRRAKDPLRPRPRDQPEPGSVQPECGGPGSGRGGTDRREPPQGAQNRARDLRPQDPTAPGGAGRPGRRGRKEGQPGVPRSGGRGEGRHQDRVGPDPDHDHAGHRGLAQGHRHGEGQLRRKAHRRHGLRQLRSARGARDVSAEQGDQVLDRGRPAHEGGGEEPRHLPVGPRVRRQGRAPADQARRDARLRGRAAEHRQAVRGIGAGRIGRAPRATGSLPGRSSPSRGERRGPPRGARMREDEQSEPLEICWRPSRAIVEQSNLARFIARNGLRSFEELLGWSVADVGRFWDAVVRDLGLEWYEPYTKVLDLSRGTPWATWWIGARFNYVHNALDRHAAGANRDKVALIWEGEDGKTARLTYGQLAAETGRCANALRALGLKKGDRVGLLLPMIPEVVVAQLAIGKLGAVFTPIFSGFGPEAVAARLQDCDARVLITCDGIERRGKLVPIKEVADRAVALSPSVEKVLVVNRLRRADVPWDPGRDLWWHELLAGQPAGADTERTAPEDPHMIIYTSGTTGRPKGVVHVQGGFPIKGVQDMAHCFDVKPSDTVFWFTDMGWMMGPWVISGRLMLSASVFLYDGTPDFPDPGRVWEMVERHRLTVVGIAPTAIRALMRAGDDWVTPRDLSSLRVLGSSGEPWNPDAWRWFQGVVGGGRCPVVNYSGGTEVSGGIVASTVITPQKPASFAGPVPGMDADVVDESGTPVRGSVRELVVRQ